MEENACSYWQLKQCRRSDMSVVYVLNCMVNKIKIPVRFS